MGDKDDNNSVDPEALPGPVLFYNEVVIDHFTNPRNVGELSPADTDGFGLVGDPSCGDQMKLWIGVRGDRIAKIAFKSFGCPGAIAKWWLVNPLSVAGILLGSSFPTTKLPHAAHVLLSTWASLFHMTMATAGHFHVTALVLVATFLFLAVWVPCCMSDIVFPLLFRDRRSEGVAR